MNEISKRDWKLFREKIGGWQEAYMDKLVKEYIQLLESDLPASKKFWELDKRMKGDKKKPGVLIELRKSNVYFELVELIQDGAITIDDLSDFSDDLKQTITRFLEK